MDQEDMNSFIYLIQAFRRAVQHSMEIDDVIDINDSSYIDETPYHTQLFALLKQLLLTDPDRSRVMALLQTKIDECCHAIEWTNDNVSDCVNNCQGEVTDEEMNDLTSTYLCAAAETVCDDIEHHIYKLNTSSNQK